VCWRTLRQTSYVAKDGVTASGYSAEYTREIRAVSYSPVSDEIIPSNATDTSSQDRPKHCSFTHMVLCAVHLTSVNRHPQWF